MESGRASKKYVENELPYRLLAELYKDSRRSFKDLGRALNISHHTISNTLKDLEEKYGLAYTLDIDTGKLGFSEGRVITIKFEERPDLDFLKRRFAKDTFVQDAYLAEGDFDMLLYVIGLSPAEFVAWQWKIRTELREYKPTLKISVADKGIIGFLPIRNELIEMSERLSPYEKNILEAMNDNSRIKLKNLIEKSKTTQMKVIYALKKFKSEGVIRKFATLVQRPTKRIFLAYTLYVSPSEKHAELSLKFTSRIVKEDLHENTSDYAVILDTVGAYDTLYLCTFEDGEALEKRGPELQKELLSDESPKIEKAILTEVIVGKWPFHLDDYSFFKVLVKE